MRGDGRHGKTERERGGAARGVRGDLPEETKRGGRTRCASLSEGMMQREEGGTGTKKPAEGNGTKKDAERNA